MKPILFSTEMVQAILDRRKTQTRRVMKPQPIETHDHFVYDGEIFLTESDMHDHLFHNVYGNNGSPYGSVYGNGTADYLWVRETWQAQNLSGKWWHEVPKKGKELHNWAVINKATLDSDLPTPPKWIPSIFMPRWASRLTLKLTDIRIERVQSISEEDAIVEGCNLDWYSDNAGTEGLWPCPTCDGLQVHLELGECLGVVEVDCLDCNTPRKMMKHLWDSINAKRSPVLKIPEWDLLTWGRDEHDDPESITLDITQPQNIMWRDPSDIEVGYWQEMGRAVPPTSGWYEVVWELGCQLERVYIHRSKPSPDDIVYPYSWSSNPWVWVVEFELGTQQ